MYDINEELAKLIQFEREEGDGEDIVISVAKLEGEPHDLEMLPVHIAELQNVWEVNLNGTRVADVSLLAHSPEMRELLLNSTLVTDLSSLANLKRLEILMLRDMPLADLSFIREMKSLKILDISGTQITDLSPLSACKNLVEVSLNDTAVSDVSPLSNLTKLRRINLDGTRINTLAPLAGLKFVEELSVSRANIENLEPLSNTTKLKRLRIDGTNVSDLSPLAGAVKMTDLSANHCAIRDLSPLARMTKLSRVYLGSTLVSDIRPIAGNKLRDLYLDGSQLADLMPIKGNRSIPRIDLCTTGISFRNTPIAKLDKNGFGAIAEMDSAFARSDALYRYFRKVKTWPLEKPLPVQTLEPVPAPPVQTGWPFLERIEEDLLELESAPVTDDAIYVLYFDRLVERAETVAQNARTFKLGDRDDLFWLSNSFANRFAYRKRNLDWRSLEEHLLRLSQAIDDATRADKSKHEDFLNTAPILLQLLVEVLNQNPMSQRLQHLLNPSTGTDQQVTKVHQAILEAFDSNDHYLFQWEARNLAKDVSRRNGQNNWRAQVADTLCRNAIIQIGDYANTYMTRGAMETDKSEDTLMWLNAHQGIVAEFARTQGDDFENWVEATLKNTAIWIKAGKPLYNPTSDEQGDWDDIRDVADRVWCGYSRSI